jgi:predicted Fe-Mo cluster-binding NifX family protein
VVNRGCGVLISGHCGPKAFAALSKAGLAVFTTGDQTVRDALAAYQAGTLKMLDTPDVDGHW